MPSFKTLYLFISALALTFETSNAYCVRERDGGNLGNITLALEEYFQHIVKVDDPICSAKIALLGQDAALESCYPLIVESNMFAVARPDYSTLDHWTSRFCMSGCNEIIYNVSSQIVDVCQAKELIFADNVLRSDESQSVYRAYNDISRKITCLKNSGGQFCLPVVAADLASAGMEVSLGGRNRLNQIMNGDRGLCHSECGSLINRIVAEYIPYANTCDTMPLPSPNPSIYPGPPGQTPTTAASEAVPFETPSTHLATGTEGTLVPTPTINDSRTTITPTTTAAPLEPSTVPLPSETTGHFDPDQLSTASGIPTQDIQPTNTWMY